MAPKKFISARLPPKSEKELVPVRQWFPYAKRNNNRIDPTTRSQNIAFLLSSNILMNSHIGYAMSASPQVPEILVQQFWTTLKEERTFYTFELEHDSFSLNSSLLQKALQLPVPKQPLDPLPSPAVLLEFVQSLTVDDYTIATLSNMHLNKLKQPWRSMLSLMNNCLTGKTTGQDKARPPMYQLLYGLFFAKNFNYSELLWDEFQFSIKRFIVEGRSKIVFARYTKIIIHHILDKGKFIARDNPKLHNETDDYVMYSHKLGNITFGVPVPDHMICKEMLGEGYFIEYMALITPKVRATTSKTMEATVKPSKPSKKKNVEEESVESDSDEDAQAMASRFKIKHNIEDTVANELLNLSKSMVEVTPPAQDPSTPEIVGMIDEQGQTAATTEVGHVFQPIPNTTSFLATTTITPTPQPSKRAMSVARAIKKKYIYNQKPKKPIRKRQTPKASGDDNTKQDILRDMRLMVKKLTRDVEQLKEKVEKLEEFKLEAKNRFKRLKKSSSQAEELEMEIVHEERPQRVSTRHVPSTSQPTRFEEAMRAEAHRLKKQLLKVMKKGKVYEISECQMKLYKCLIAAIKDDEREIARRQ